jgi:hypothetical protein
MDTIFGSMKNGRKPKSPKPPGFMRSVVAANLVRLLNHHYRDKDTITARQKALEEDCGVRFSTIQRICQQQVGANLDTLEQIALAFELSVYQLLLPELDPGNPGIVKEASAAEKRAYALWRRGKALPTPARTPEKVT